MLVYLVFVGAFATLCATYLYIRSMFRGQVKPNRMSWLMWSIAPFIGSVAAVSSGVGWVALPVFMSGFSPFLIFTASFLTKKAYWKLAKFDYFCGTLSALALILWLVTKDPNVAIFFAVASDFLASIPTLTKAWYHPETESPWPFIVGVFNASTAFTATITFTFTEIGFAAYLVIINAMLFLAVNNKKIALFFSRIKESTKA